MVIGKAIKFLRNLAKSRGDVVKGSKDTVIGAIEDLGTLADGYPSGEGRGVISTGA